MFSLWSRLAAGSIDLDHPRRAQPGEQDRRFDLRRGFLVDEADAAKIAAVDRHRQRAALGARAHRPQWREHALHRAAAQRGVAGKSRSDRKSRGRAHQQARTGAAVAAVDRTGRALPFGAAHAPFARAEPVDLGAERAHRLGRMEHVIAFEQPADPRFAARQVRRGSRRGATSTCHPAPRCRRSALRSASR